MKLPSRLVQPPGCPGALAAISGLTVSEASIFGLGPGELRGVRVVDLLAWSLAVFLAFRPPPVFCVDISQCLSRRPVEEEEEAGWDKEEGEEVEEEEEEEEAGWDIVTSRIGFFGAYLVY